MRQDFTRRRRTKILTVATRTHKFAPVQTRRFLTLDMSFVFCFWMFFSFQLCFCSQALAKPLKSAIISCYFLILQCLNILVSTFKKNYRFSRWKVVQEPRKMFFLIANSHRNYYFKLCLGTFQNHFILTGKAFHEFSIICRNFVIDKNLLKTFLSWVNCW